MSRLLCKHTRLTRTRKGAWLETFYSLHFRKKQWELVKQIKDTSPGSSDPYEKNTQKETKIEVKLVSSLTVGVLQTLNTQLNFWRSPAASLLPQGSGDLTILPTDLGQRLCGGVCPRWSIPAHCQRKMKQAQEQKANVAAEERSPVKSLCYCFTLAAFLTPNPLEPDAMLIKAYWISNSEEVQGQVC